MSSNISNIGEEINKHGDHHINFDHGNYLWVVSKMKDCGRSCGYSYKMECFSKVYKRREKAMMNSREFDLCVNSFQFNKYRRLLKIQQIMEV